MKGTLTSKQRISWLFENGEKFSTASFLALYGRSCEPSDFKGANNEATQCSRGTSKSPNTVLASQDLSPLPQCSKTQEAIPGKTAFIAGKKLGVAPIRSRAKRRLREAAHASGEIWESYDVALVARKGAVEKDFSALVADMHRLGEHLERDITRFPEEGECNKERITVSAEQRQETTASKETQNSNAALSEARDEQDQEPAASTGSKVLRVIIGIPRTIALLCIKLYRQAISPLLPPSCRYVPTCSEYALIAIERFGFWKGLWLSVKRVGRCHPFAEGGYDPVPEATRRS